MNQPTTEIPNFTDQLSVLRNKVIEYFKSLVPRGGEYELEKIIPLYIQDDRYSQITAFKISKKGNLKFICYTEHDKNKLFKWDVNAITVHQLFTIHDTFRKDVLGEYENTEKEEVYERLSTTQLLKHNVVKIAIEDAVQSFEKETTISNARDSKRLVELLNNSSLIDNNSIMNEEFGKEILSLYTKAYAYKYQELVNSNIPLKIEIAEDQIYIDQWTGELMLIRRIGICAIYFYKTQQEGRGHLSANIFIDRMKSRRYVLFS